MNHEVTCDIHRRLRGHSSPKLFHYGGFVAGSGRLPLKKAVELDRRALNRENPGSNPPAAVWKVWQFRSSHVATDHSAV